MLSVEAEAPVPTAHMPQRLLEVFAHGAWRLGCFLSAPLPALAARDISSASASKVSLALMEEKQEQKIPQASSPARLLLSHYSIALSFTVPRHAGDTRAPQQPHVPSPSPITRSPQSCPL